MENIKKVNNLESLNKESRIFLFLKEVGEVKNLDNNKLKELYLKKYNLSEKSNSINIRVIERFMGVYSKYSKEKKENKVKLLKESLINLKIDYKDLLNSFEKVKKFNKRSNRISLSLDLKELEI